MLDQLFARRTTRRGLAANRRQRAAARCRMLGETLERRSMLAVSASVSAGTLNIALSAGGDAAFLSYTGSAYTLTNGSGAAVSGSPFSGVTAGVSVAGAAGTQSFTFGGAVALPVSLSVASSVETATINTAIAASGLANSVVSLSSPTITLAADVMTAGGQTYAGAVLLAGAPSLTSTTATVSFQSTVNTYVGIGLTAQATFATGTNPRSSAIGDVNGDGKPDLAIANEGSNSVSVLLNTTAPGATAPSYAAQATFATGSGPQSIATGDMNGDGRPDLVIANGNSSSVSVLLNTTAPGATTPSYAAQATFATGSLPTAVSIADLNGDGKPDLATANRLSNSVSVLLNTTAPGATAPSYAAQATFATGSNPQSIATGDINGDGKLDLIIGNFGVNSVGVLLNTTATGATTPSYAAQVTFATGSAPLSVVIGDLNGDGKSDLAIANRSANSVGVLLNTTATGATTPSYAAQATFATGSTPRSVSIADLNGDGKPDLAIANSGSASVSVLLNTTVTGATVPSYAAQATFATGSSPYSVSIGDLNGDGIPDLAISNRLAGNVSVLLNTTLLGPPSVAISPQGTFATGQSPRSVSIGDLNGDGKPDLAIANTLSNSVSLLLNTTAPGATAPSYAAQATFATGSKPRSISTGDLNGDGKPDLAIANYGSDSVSVFLNTTAPGATTPSYAAQATFATGTNPISVSIGDINGDGKPDLAIANVSSGSVSVLLNTTAPGATTPSYAAQATFATELSPYSVSIGDLNGDGKPDLAIANNTSASVSVLLNTAAPGATTPSYADQTTFATGISPVSVAIGDVNGDGKPDLTIANLSSASVSVLLTTTAPGATVPSYAAQTTFATGTTPFSVSIGDLNGDGKPDLAIANSSSDSVSVLLNATASGNLTAWSATGTTFAAAAGGTTPLGSVAIAGGPTSLGSTVTTTGTQTYTGAITLAADATLTGTTITTGSTVAGAAKALAITGNAVVGGAITGLTTYSVSGTTSLGADVTTTGTQTYTGAVTLAANATLTGTTPTFTAGVTGNSNNLTLNFSGTTALDGAKFTGIKDLATGNGGSTTLAGTITTSGAQTYNDAVTLAANATLVGTTITTGSTVAGAANALAITGNAVVGGAITGLTTYSVSGTTSLGADVTTTGTQTYTGAVTLTANATLAGTTVTTGSTVAGASKALAITGNVVVNGAITDLTTYSVSGTASLGGNVTTTGAQTYAGVVQIIGSPSLTSTTATVSFQSTVDMPFGLAAQAAFAAGASPFSVSIGDLNGDGKPDLAIANRDSNSVSVLLNTAATGATTASYAAQATFATGSSPRSVSIGDLNGDGKPDLAIANYMAHSVSVLLNTTAPGATTPSYSPQATFATGFFARSVSIGDVNGDGKPDLAVANAGSASVSVLLNTTAPGATTPSYAAQATFAAGAIPYSISIGDVNGDGKPDLATANINSASASVLLNTTAPGATAPSYAAQATFATGASPTSVAIGDLNGDGKPDLAIANGSPDSVSVLLNTTAPGATAPSYAAQATFATGSLPFSVSIADMNGDGKPDLAIANRLSNSVSVLLNTTLLGPPVVAISPHATFATGSIPNSVSVGDVNGDGKPDLAIANLSSNSVSVLLSTTAPGATTPSYAAQATFATGPGPSSVSIGDLNGDGKPDLAITNSSSNSVSVLLNTTAPGATAPSYASQATFAARPGAYSVSIADLNGDGKPDLAIANSSSNSVSVLLSTTAPGATTPSYAAQASFATGSAPVSVVIGDLNGDGKPDLAIANRTSGSTSVLLNTTATGATTPSYSAQATFATGSIPRTVSIGDLNGDGKPDLAVANSGSNSMSVLMNTTATGATTPSYAAQATFFTGTNPFSVAIGDLNGDGKPDLAVTNYNSQSVSVLLNTTTPGATRPSYVPQATFTTGLGPVSVAISDVNGDGKPDLAITNGRATSVSVLLNATTSGNLTVSSAAGTTFAAAAGGSSPLAGVTIASGPTSLGGNVTTTGPQTYTGTVTLAANTTLTGTTPTFTAGVTGNSNNLTLNFSGTTAIDGAKFNGIKDLATGNGGTTTLAGTITTSGVQTYNDAVTLAATTTLAGTTITTGSTVAGAGNALAITGNAVVGGAITGLTTYSVSGTTSLGGSVTTSGAQTYTGGVTLTANTTLTGTTLSLGSGVNHAGSTLSVVFATISLNAATGQTVTYAAPLVGTSNYVKTGGGTLVITAASALTGPMAVQQGTLRLANAAALASSQITPAAGGMVTLAPALQTTVGGLNPNAGGLVDVGNGMVTVAAGLSAANMVAAILSGLGDGSWNGTSGITSSVAAASGGDRTVGWLDNGDGSMTFGFAAAGDTNLDWQVDIIDAANFLAGGKFDSGTPATWNQGDFTYDGFVDILDAASFLANGLFDAGLYNTPAPQAASSSGLAADPGFLSPFQAAFASFAAASTETQPTRKNRTAIR